MYENMKSKVEQTVVSGNESSAKGAYSSPPAIPQHSRTESEIINGLRIDMVRLQEQMDSMQSTLDTCIKMQHELRRSVQQEVSSALSQFSTPVVVECACVIEVPELKGRERLKLHGKPLYVFVESQYQPML
ncbi:hypothetical protein Tco_0127688 [Tanacetum coccineum]